MDSSIIDMLSKLADLMLACGAILVGLYHFALRVCVCVWRRARRRPAEPENARPILIRADPDRQPPELPYAD